MNPIRLLSASAQVAAHLRAELERSRWSEGMPGVNWLAEELGVNRKTVVAALLQLEKEGLLSNQGQGRKRLIIPPKGTAVRPMRIAILEYDSEAGSEGYMVAMQHLLLTAGHSAFFTTQSLRTLGMEVPRIRRLVGETSADAWIIGAGSREVLEWFSALPVPAFALFGRREGLPIAATGPDKTHALSTATRHLISLGHRRIVLLCHQERRVPEPGRPERVFLDELNAHGVLAGDYNLPDWEETNPGLQALLTSLFRVTPPTAMIIDEAPLFSAVQQFLAARGIRVPQQVSLICTDADPTFSWCTPSISHIRWDTGAVIRRVVRWAARVSTGRQDLKQTYTAAEFIPGGTIGPCAK